MCFGNFEDECLFRTCRDDTSDARQSSFHHEALVFPLLWLPVTACWLQHAHLKLTLLLSPMMMSPQLETLSKHQFASPTSLGEPWRPTRHQTVLRRCAFICLSWMCQTCPGGVIWDQKAVPCMTCMTSSTPPLYGESVFLTLLFVPLLFSSFWHDSVAVRTKAVEH